MRCNIIFLFLSCLLVFTHNGLTQASWQGKYRGTFNGDSVFLEFVLVQDGQASGTMHDSYNHYVVQGLVMDSVFSGTAQENTLGLTFQMTSLLRGDMMATQMVFDYLGMQNKMDIFFTREIPVSLKVSNKPSNATAKNPVSGRHRDRSIAGLWSKESNYSSGYGSNNTYGSMSTKEYMEFLPDGRIATGGSSTVIGGSNYTGITSDRGNQVAEGWFWYSEGNRIYLHIVQQGQGQDVALGKYYIENGRMLITADNGVKMLLTRE